MTSETSENTNDVDISLIQLDPAFIARHWAEIVQRLEPMMALEEGLPLDVAATNLLQYFLCGSLQLWAAFGDKVVRGYCVTSKFLGTPAGTRSLAINYLTLDALPPESLVKAFTKITDYARAQGCRMIIAGTASKYISQLGERLGAEVRTELIWRL